MYGTGVTVKRLRRNILCYCIFGNDIVLQPVFVRFKREWTEGVILYETAHYKYKHHRKSIREYLSALIGDDSGLAESKYAIALSPYYEYYLYLTKDKNKKRELEQMRQEGRK